MTNFINTLVNTAVYALLLLMVACAGHQRASRPRSQRCVWSEPCQISETSSTPNNLDAQCEGGDQVSLYCPYLFVPTTVVMGRGFTDQAEEDAWFEIAYAATDQFNLLTTKYPYASFCKSLIARQNEEPTLVMVDAIHLHTSLRSEEHIDYVAYVIEQGWSIYFRRNGEAPDPFHLAYIEAEIRAQQAVRGLWSKPSLIKFFTSFEVNSH